MRRSSSQPIINLHLLVCPQENDTASLDNLHLSRKYRHIRPSIVVRYVASACEISIWCRLFNTNMLCRKFNDKRIFAPVRQLRLVFPRPTARGRASRGFLAVRPPGNRRSARGTRRTIASSPAFPRSDWLRSAGSPSVAAVFAALARAPSALPDRVFMSVGNISLFGQTDVTFIRNIRARRRPTTDIRQDSRSEIIITQSWIYTIRLWNEYAIFSTMF